MTKEDSDIGVSIVIPSYNGLHLLRECIPSLQAAIEQAGLTDKAEIIVVDDASTDETVNWLSTNAPDVRMLENPHNYGFAKTANAGLSAAVGEWVALVNNDIVVEPDWLSAARRHFENPQVATVASRIMSTRTPGLIEEAGDEYTTVGIPYKPGRHGGTDTIPSPRRCFAACGASVFYRREALADIGIFYEPLNAYYEDVELGFRLNLGGWDCLYEGDSVCHHLGSATYGSGSFRQKFNTARNAEIVYFTCMPGWLVLRYLPARLLATVLLTGHHILKGTVGPYLLGKLSAMIQPIRTLRRRREVQASRRISSRQLREKLHGNWFGLLVMRRSR